MKCTGVFVRVSVCFSSRHVINARVGLKMLLMAPTCFVSLLSCREHQERHGWPTFEGPWLACTYLENFFSRRTGRQDSTALFWARMIKHEKETQFPLR